MTNKLLRIAANSFPVLFLLFSLCSSSHAQETSQQKDEATQLQIGQLNDLVASLSAKRAVRETLRETMAAADADDVAELKESLDELSVDIRQTRFAIEQIAVGTVDLGEFEEESTALDWRTELGQVLMPVMQNLKRITEKPRKIELLKSKIARATEQKIDAEAAATNIATTLDSVSEPATQELLKLLQESWTGTAQDLEREISLASVQLDNIQRSDTPIWIQVRDALVSFFKGRGLTILIAVLAAFAVHFGMKLIGNIASKRQKGEDVKEFRTRQRIIHYGLKAVKSLLILIVVMVVFYVRGDILLMAIAFLIAAGLVLSLRHTIPRFMDELRLLLNLGSIREDERVMYQGLPWKVTQLNMYSVLKNPEITGIHRVPIQEMMSLTSRPAGNEPWFPASKNDYVLLDDGRMLQVTKITPEHVLLESLHGTKTMYPTAEFYQMVFENISRSPTYFVSSVFGVGYSHQSDSVVAIPEKLKQALTNELSKSELSEHVVGVSCELQEAGASSLDIWLGVKMKCEAATSYFRIKRMIQQVCVSTCTNENWDIPFPQLTLHNN